MSLDEGSMRDDSGKPITAEWLRGQPWAKEDDEDSFVIDLDDDCRFLWTEEFGIYQKHIYGTRIYHARVNTRGRLSYLLAAFGMEVRG